MKILISRILDSQFSRSVNPPTVSGNLPYDPHESTLVTDSLHSLVQQDPSDPQKMNAPLYSFIFMQDIWFASKCLKCNTINVS